jgi:AcrR family transcriptional regulator
MPVQSRSRDIVTAVLEALDEALTSGADFDEVTIEGVSDRAGVGVGSFYEYFSGKDSLLASMVARVTERNFTYLAALLDAHASSGVEAAIEVMAREVAQTYLAHPKRTRVVAHAIGRMGLTAVVTRERDRFAELMADHAVRLLPREQEARLRRTMQLIADGCIGVVVAEIDREPTRDPEMVRQELVELSMGLMTMRHPAAFETKRSSRQ